MNNTLVLYNLYIMHKKCDRLLEAPKFETNTHHFELSYSQFTETSTLCHQFFKLMIQNISVIDAIMLFGIITREKEVLRIYNDTN